MLWRAQGLFERPGLAFSDLPFGLLGRSHAAATGREISDRLFVLVVIIELIEPDGPRMTLILWEFSDGFLESFRSH